MIVQHIVELDSLSKTRTVKFTSLEALRVFYTILMDDPGLNPEGASAEGKPEVEMLEFVENIIDGQTGWLQSWTTRAQVSAI